MAEAQEQVQSWSIGRVLRWAGDDFRARGLDSPRLDAELLLGHALGLDRVKLIVDAERPLTSDELGRFRELIKRRRKAEPIAYILGEREFFGLSFRVDRRVLVPRPDTETLVEAALERTRANDMFGHALDLCTGSGCVAIAFAKRRRTWKVTGTDRSPGAIEVARDNALRLGVGWGTRFVVSDLFDALGTSERFDLITANPPYIPTPELGELAADIKGFEPRDALDGGSDGLDLLRRIVEQAPARLAPGGLLALEVGHDQAERVAGLMQARGFGQLARHRDYGGHQRVVSGVLGL